MNEPAAIRATFSDFKLIKGRRCAQLVFEVPIEEADAAVRTIGGMPQPATERWCGIALLDIAKPTQEPAKEKRSLADMSPAQQAALRCKQPAFQQFILERMLSAKRFIPQDETPEERTSRYVRKWCGVNSRSELDKDKGAENVWIELDNAYFGWQRGVE